MTTALTAIILVGCVLIGVTGTLMRCFRYVGGGQPRVTFEAFVWCAALGLGILAYGVLLIGSAGWLRKEVFVGVLVLLLAVGVRTFFAEFGTLAQRASKVFAGAGVFEKALVVPAAIVLFFSLAASLAPAVGQDELCYHLTQPQNFVRAHQIYEVPYSINSLWPYLTHMLFTLGLLLQGAEAAKLFHWIFYVLTALAIGAFGRRFANGRAGWIAAVCYLVAPAALTQAGYAYIDHALALYVFLAFYAAYAWKHATASAKGWAWLAGIAAGLAASVKLIGLFAAFPVALVAVTAWRSGGGVRRGWGPDAARMALGMTAAGAVWYVRSWILRGNPVYPFYPQLFGGHGFYDATYVGVHGREGIWGFLTLPWDLTFHPDFFGGEVLGPLFLACVPFAGWRGRTGPARMVGASLLVYAAVWYRVDPNIRFFFAGLAWMSVLSGLAVDGWLRGAAKSGQKVLGALFLILTAAQTAFAPYHFWDEARLLLGGSRERYLQERERSSRVAEQVNRFLKPDDWILSAGEIRGFYFEPRFTLVGDFERMTPAETIPDDPERLAAFLKSIGFTHLLTSDMDFGPGERAKIERVVTNRAASRPFFKDELVVRSQGHSFVIYRIL